MSLDSDIVVPSQSAVRDYVANNAVTTINAATEPVQEFFIQFGGTGESTPTINTIGGNHTIYIPYADGGRPGVITAAQYLDFIGKVPSTRTLTINGTSYDLSADRSWTIASSSTQSIGATVDGSGGTITIGVKGYVQIPYACTITSWRVIANAVGSIQFDIFRATSGTIPTVSLIGGGGNKPLLSTAQTNSAAPTGWTSTAIAANDMLAFNVDSATTVSWAVVQLTVTRT